MIRWVMRTSRRVLCWVFGHRPLPCVVETQEHYLETRRVISTTCLDCDQAIYAMVSVNARSLSTPESCATIDHALRAAIADTQRNIRDRLTGRPLYRFQ